MPVLAVSVVVVVRRCPLLLLALAALLAAALGCSPSDKPAENEAKSPPAAKVPAAPSDSPAPAAEPTDEPEIPPTTPTAQPLAPADPPGLTELQPAPSALPPATEGPTDDDANPLRGDAPTAEPVPVDPAPPLGAAQSGLPPLPGKHGGEPFDWLKENGPIFAGWGKPKLAFVITGQQHGYMEPCGCAGLDRMKGGMSRRHTLFRELRNDKQWPVVGLDVGGIARGYGRQAEIKFQIMINGMRKMGYDAIGLGQSDLQLPADALAAEVAGEESPFVAANVNLYDLAAKTQVIEAGGMKIGVTAVLGKEYQKAINNPEIVFSDPEQALAEVLPSLKKEADYLVLLAHTTMQESVDLAKKFPDFNLVVTAGGAPEPPARPTLVQGTKTLLVEVGEKGMDAVVVGLFDDPQAPLRYQRVPLDARFKASPEMRLLMEAYQDQLRAIGYAGLGIPVGAKAPPHPQAETNGRFVGSAKCQACHEPSFDVWRRSGHAKAYDTLAKLDPPRDADPECISCHVIGWHPTKYFPYRNGFESLAGNAAKGLAKTPHLVDVGCESCHGPGGGHLDAEMGNDPALQKKMQQALVITKAEADDVKSGKAFCRSCHDLDNSPDFDFDLYWPHVEHYESE